MSMQKALIFTIILLAFIFRQAVASDFNHHWHFQVDFSEKRTMKVTFKEQGFGYTLKKERHNRYVIQFFLIVGQDNLQMLPSIQVNTPVHTLVSTSIPTHAIDRAYTLNECDHEILGGRGFSRGINPRSACQLEAVSSAANLNPEAAFVTLDTDTRKATLLCQKKSLQFDSSSTRANRQRLFLISPRYLFVLNEFYQLLQRILGNAHHAAVAALAACFLWSQQPYFPNFFELFYVESFLFNNVYLLMPDQDQNIGTVNIHSSSPDFLSQFHFNQAFPPLIQQGGEPGSYIYDQAGGSDHDYEEIDDLVEPVQQVSVLARLIARENIMRSITAMVVILSFLYYFWS